MGRIEEATLFRPGQVNTPGRPGAGKSGGQRGREDDEDEGPPIAIRERVFEALRSAQRRKGLSLVVMVLCGALTTLAATFVPKTYEVESRVLVQRTNVLSAQQQQYVSPEEMHNQAREYEEQVMAHDNIITIVKQNNLVGRWERMRQPHRRLIDQLNAKLGRPPPSDDQKFEALVSNIQGRMKVWVDATTISVKLDWSEPESARDIVESAVKNFLEARFQAEVGVIPARLKIQETFVAQAHKELEEAAGVLASMLKANDPERKPALFVPALPQGLRNDPPADADPATKAKLENIRMQMATVQNEKAQRVAQLSQQLIEKRQTLAEGHPEVVALKATLAQTDAQDPPQVISLRAQEKQILDEIALKQREQAAQRAERAPVRPTPSPVQVAEKLPPPSAMAPKNVQDAQVQFDTVSAKYQELVKQLQGLLLDMQTAEAAYKNRYRITLPAEVPIAPKRPAGLIAAALGVLATFAAILVAASLADRLSGIFYEPRDVRDRLGLPVYATFS